MLPRFRVFHHSAAQPRQIIVQRLGDEELNVAAGSSLGGYKIAPHLSQPRALDDAGQPRTDLFVFTFISEKPPKLFTEGELLTLETLNQHCAACRSEWTEPELSDEELAELRELLDQDRRIDFVRRLREMSGLGLASAKAILDHTDFHVSHCKACDALIEAGRRVICSQCGALTYPWHSPDWAPPPRRGKKSEGDAER
jgi:hypothetical protein